MHALRGRKQTPEHVETRAAAHRVAIEARIMRNVAMTDWPNACWIWIGADIGNSGRPRITIRRKRVTAARASYECFVAPIPLGMSVLHHCDLPLCVNPKHLFVGTQRDNYQDAKAKGRNSARERHGMSKLSSEQVAEIRASALGSRKLAPIYGVSDAHIRHIRTGRVWRNS